MTSILRRVLAGLLQSVWGPLVGKGLMWVVAFLALAHVGGGAAARLVEPPQPRLGAAMAIGASAVAGATASASRSSKRARASPPPCVNAAVGGRVVLNRASAEELTRLPGVGKKRAEAILEVRRQLGGRFRRVRDLLRVRGIGHRSLKRLEPHVVLDAKPTKPARRGQ